MGATSSFLENIEWRRAVKHFGGGPVDASPIVKAIVNAPSSFGLQPYTIIAIKNKELKEKLQKVSYNQAQVSECDTLFVFCARSDIENRIEEYVQANNAAAMRDMMMGFAKHIPDKVAWASKQAYISLGFALAAAAEQKIASCPMEGFNSAEVSKILQLPQNLTPCVYLAVGENVEQQNSERFRFPVTDLVHFM